MKIHPIDRRFGSTDRDGFTRAHLRLRFLDGSRSGTPEERLEVLLVRVGRDGSREHLDRPPVHRPRRIATGGQREAELDC